MKGFIDYGPHRIPIDKIRLYDGEVLFDCRLMGPQEAMAATFRVLDPDGGLVAAVRGGKFVLTEIGPKQMASLTFAVRFP